MTVYNTGSPAVKPCPNHTHRRPISVSSLTIRLRAAEEWVRRHAWHNFLDNEAGCPLCRREELRNLRDGGGNDE